MNLIVNVGISTTKQKMTTLSWRAARTAMALRAAPLLGVNGLVFIAHGRSDAVSIKNAVRVAKQAAEAKVLDAMKSAIEESLKK